MKGYWLTFTDGSHGYCEGSTAFDAKHIAEKLTGKKVSGGEYENISAKELPHPANPIIWQLDHPVYGKCPAFCITPTVCSGKTACPKARACSE